MDADVSRPHDTSLHSIPHAHVLALRIHTRDVVKEMVVSVVERYVAAAQSDGLAARALGDGETDEGGCDGHERGLFEHCASAEAEAP